MMILIKQNSFDPDIKAMIILLKQNLEMVLKNCHMFERHHTSFHISNLITLFAVEISFLYSHSQVDVVSDDQRCQQQSVLPATVSIANVFQLHASHTNYSCV